MTDTADRLQRPRYRGEIVEISPQTLADMSGHHRSMFEDQRVSREPHEADFNVFGLFRNQNSVFFDVGANIGNSALSLHVVQPTWRVVSFEPNTGLMWFHQRVEKIFAESGAEFEVHYVGLGQEKGDLEFYIPAVDDWYVIGEASFDLDHFADPTIAGRISGYSAHGAWRLARTRFPVVRFDAYPPMQAVIAGLTGAEGLFVKIDVEGLEEAALGGMEGFIKTYRPIMMIENSPADRVQDLLFAWNYHSYFYDSLSRSLYPSQERSGQLNSFYIHAEAISSGLLDDVVHRARDR